MTPKQLVIFWTLVLVVLFVGALGWRPQARRACSLVVLLILAVAGCALFVLDDY